MPRARQILACCLLLVSALATGCGEGKIEPPKTQVTEHRGAQLFNERCSGCHTLKAANARGSKPTNQVSGGERTNGPNFNVRKETSEDVLYAIRNGGFSGAIMPANIVVGKDARDVARFVERYAGSESEEQGNTEAPPGSSGTGG
jgi:mono/diheme cytochrome c family protein